jgi:dTDP-4-amino-4,6-dideoxygalactose transaminase
MEGIQGAVLNVKLAHLTEWNNKRRNAADNYRKYLNDVEEFCAPEEAGYAKHIYHLFELKTKSEEIRNRLREFLGGRGIQTGLHYPAPVHLQPAYSGLGHSKGDFHVCENAAECLLSLPMFPEITCGQVEYVVDCIKEFFSK